MPVSRQYESVAAAAQRTGLSTRTLRRRVAEGKLPAYRCGRVLRLRPEDVDALFKPTWSRGRVA